MEHDVYYWRQRAIIERSLQAEKERKELEESIRSYQHELEGRKSYNKLMRTKRSKVVRSGTTRVEWKSDHASYRNSERQIYRTKRFSNSYITVYCKGRPTR